jgi:hypothetical protein
MCFSASAVVPKLVISMRQKLSCEISSLLTTYFGYFSPLLQYIAGLVNWPHKEIVVQEPLVVDGGQGQHPKSAVAFRLLKPESCLIGGSMMGAGQQTRMSDQKGKDAK